MATADGLSIFKSVDLDETEEAVKTTKGKVYGWAIYNAHATLTRYVKLYNATVANVVVGTTVPVLTLPVAALSWETTAPGEVGLQFDTAITAAATTGVADADTGAPAANDVICHIFYQ